MTRDMRLRSGVAVLFFTLALSGCYKSLRTLPLPDAGDGADGTVVTGEDADGSSFTIAITSPASPAYTNNALEVDITASSGTSQTVQLLDNGTLLATLSAAPYRFTWDTTKVAEGNHQLVAQEAVGSQIVASAPVTVIVDRTPPTIVSKSPASGAGNVSLTDPIQVVFSEALARSSITAGAVSLALGSATVGSTASLGTDGKTIGVAIADRASLALPGTMTETVGAGIMDLAGNAFAGASWSFAVPLWVDLGTVAAGTPQIALEPSGAPVVLTNSGSFQIARHIGGVDWDTSIPSPQTAGTIVSGSPSFAVGSSGEIYVSWTESSSQSVHVARWTGSAWDRSYGALLTSATASAEGSNIALTSTGQPIVHWVEPVTMGRGPGYVSHWNGSSWTSYPGAPGDYLGPMVLDRSDMPIVVAGYQVSRWTGSSWTPSQGTNVYALAINSADAGIGLQAASDGSFQPLALSKAGVLTNYVPALTGESAQSILAFRVVIDRSDQPIISWYSNVGGTSSSAQLHVARWTGSAWDKGFGVLANAGDVCAMALAGGSVPIVAWPDSAGTATHVSKSNH